MPIRVIVAEFADNETLGVLGIEDPWDLSGLYHGRPMDEESVWATGELPPLITLYRGPILLEWIETGAELEALVAHVVIHEVGHHEDLMLREGAYWRLYQAQARHEAEADEGSGSPAPAALPSLAHTSKDSDG